MRIGCVSDAHGNPQALAACLALLSRAGVDRYVFLGDAVGYLPRAGQVLALLRAAGCLCLKGNHEAMLLGDRPIEGERDAVYRLAETRRALAPADWAWLRSWRLRLAWEVGGQRLMFAHGSPWHPLDEYVYPDTPLDRFTAVAADVFFMGHTHRPFAASADDKTVFNVGSCGLPRDHGNAARCLIYDTRERRGEFVTVPFDVEDVIRHAGAIHPGVAACLRRDPLPISSKMRTYQP